MRLVSLILVSVCAYGAQFMGGTTNVTGALVTYTTHLEPPTPPISSHGGGTLTQDDIIKRHVCNFDNNTYFGYDLTVEPLAEGRFRLKFAPLTISAEQMSKIFDKVPKWTPLPLPAGPAPMDVRAGDTVALDLFVNTSTGQKVTDYLTITPTGPQQNQGGGRAQNFGAEDALMEIRSPQVRVDGKPTLSSPRGVSGQAVWLDLPGHGRFVFSLAPRPDLGMQRAGEIRGATMTWHAAGRHFLITAEKPITAGPRAYNVYVLHLPHPIDAFGIFGGARPDDAIRSR